MGDNQYIVSNTQCKCVSCDQLCRPVSEFCCICGHTLSTWFQDLQLCCAEHKRLTNFQSAIFVTCILYSSNQFLGLLYCLCSGFLHWWPVFVSKYQSLLKCCREKIKIKGINTLYTLKLCRSVWACVKYDVNFSGFFSWYCNAVWLLS